MTETEANHSQHIIKELLELLVGANQIGLEVSSSRATRCCSFAGVRHRRWPN
nr:hypothetical protein [Variovorax paradoxus]